MSSAAPMLARRGLGPLLILLGLVVAARLVGSRVALVAVDGDSMAPTLLHGDWLIAESFSYRRRPPRDRDLVLAADPRRPDRELVKRAFRDPAGGYRLLGDAPARSTDSRDFGPVPAASLRWRVAVRYWPPRRGAVVR